MQIAVAGTGYVGLVTGVCLAEMGHNVVCFDIDSSKINLMQSARSPIYEDGLEELMRRNKNRLRYTTDHQVAFANADVVFIGVGTPENSDGSANVSGVYQVAKLIAKTVENDCLIAVKSTVPIGTCDDIENFIMSIGKNDVHLEVASNPEFLSQGTAVRDTLYASRIVLGVNSKWAEERLRQVYVGFNQPYVITDRRSAEMIKYASNCFLALKISFINEIANMCEKVGADVQHVARGMGLDPRIGNKFLQAGIGFGGSCFPKDTKALCWLAKSCDYKFELARATIEVNKRQKTALLRKARKYYNTLRGLEVAVLGLTFKPGTDDLREAPSLDNIRGLLEEESLVRVWDPVGMEKCKEIYPTQLTYCPNIEDTITGADICFIFTEWPDIVGFDLHKFTQLMRRPIVLDGRNCYDLRNAEDAGIVYESVGRRVINGYSDNRCAMLGQEINAS